MLAWEQIQQEGKHDRPEIKKMFIINLINTGKSICNYRMFSHLNHTILGVVSH